MPNNNDELDLERKKAEEQRQKSRDDELERERTIDGEEIYNPEEEKVNIEEEECDASLDDDMPDEYYEDMFEEDWEEIEAAEAAKKEKKDRLERIKAKRKAREKKLKAERDAEARRKEAERLAAQHKQQSETSHRENRVEADTYQSQTSDYSNPHVEVESAEYSRAHKKEMWENEQREAEHQETVIPEKQYNVPANEQSATHTADVQNSDFHNHMVDGVKEAEYSRTHKSEQAAEQGTEFSHVGSHQFQNADSVPIEPVQGSVKRDEKSEDGVSSASPIVGLKQDNTVQHQNDVASGTPVETQHGIGINPTNNDVFAGRGISVEEKPFYTELGIPVSVSTAASAYFAAESGANVVGSHVFEDLSHKAGPGEVAHEAAKTGAKVSSTLSMPDYMRVANNVLANYDKETALLNAHLNESRAKLQSLKDNGGSAKEIQAVRSEIKFASDKLKTITADRVRVADFVQNGARSMSHITKDDVMNAEYSRSHSADLKGRKQSGDVVGDGVEGGNKKLFYSSSNLKQIHKNRVRNLAGSYMDRAWKGTKGGFKRVLREDDDLDQELEVVDTTLDTRRMLSSHVATIYMNRELSLLGLGHDAIKQSLKEMGVIVGVGDVSKMSLKDLERILANETFSPEIQKKLIEAIDLKKRLGMSNFQLADLALKEAGEYANYSVKRLQKMLKRSDLDIVKKAQIEAALRYNKLSKWNRLASGKWKITANLFGGLAQKVFRNNEHLASAIGIGQNAMTAYRAGKVVVKATSHAVQGTAKAGKALVKGTKKTIVGLKNRADLLAKKQILYKQGIRQANLVGKGAGAAARNIGVKGGSKFAQSKIGQWAANAFSGLKEGLAAAGKAISGAVKGLGALIGGGSAAGTLLFILIIVLLFAVVICGTYVLIFGDESNGTSVPEMVQHLEDKNTAWLSDIDNIATGQPGTQDRAGNNLDEYTKVTYTYLDSDGDVCMVTDNTKEIVSMAAVYFQQNFSNADDVFDYLNKMWDASHELTVTKSNIYGCDGEICLNEDLTFNTDAQGFNAGTRTFSCTENWSNISYGDCFKISSENEWRVNLSKTWSYRFNSSVATASKYSGIANLRTKSITMGYGCQEKTETFYCTNIRNIANSEVLVKLVDATGIPYSTLNYQKGCVTKHTGTYEGAPCSGCSDYTLIRKYFTFTSTSMPQEDCVFTWNASRRRYECTATNNRTYVLRTGGQGTGGQYLNIDELDVWYDSDNACFKYSVPYYECDEKTCSGHSVTYHYCPGDHKEMVCYGHVDLDVNIEVLGFDKIFEIEVTDLPYYHDGTHGGVVDTSRICTHSNTTVNETDSNGYVIKWTCNDCGVIYSTDGGYDYSNSNREDRPGDNDDTLNMNIWLPEDIEWCKSIHAQNWEDFYGVYVPSSLFEGTDGVVSAIMPTHANSLPIPLLNQGDYPNSPYGSYGTVASHGCGITCVAMLDSYYKDQTTSPAYLARIFGHYNTAEGSYWSLFADSAEVLMIPFEKQTNSWPEVVAALQAGKPVVSSQSSAGPFTSGGHFILLTGITPDGKILVNDPNGANYRKNQLLIDGFANGFSQSQIQVGAKAYWIYGVKPGTEPTDPTNPPA